MVDRCRLHARPFRDLDRALWVVLSGPRWWHGSQIGLRTQREAASFTGIEQNAAGECIEDERMTTTKEKTQISAAVDEDTELDFGTMLIAENEDGGYGPVISKPLCIQPADLHVFGKTCGRLEHDSDWPVLQRSPSQHRFACDRESGAPSTDGRIHRCPNRRCNRR
jgi:hypothetical protein